MAFLIWSPGAVDDLEAIVEFISRDSPTYACLFATEIVLLIETIPEQPRAGRVVPEYRESNLSERIFRNYRIVYRLKEHDLVEVVTIFHGSRLPRLR